MNFNEYFEKANDVWNFKHKALTAAYKMFGLFINFNYATSEIEFVDNENVIVIFRNDENRTVFNRSCKVKWLEMAIEVSPEIARKEMDEAKAKNKKLGKQIAENMARLGGSHEFWKRRLTHGWDALEAKLSELHTQGLNDEQIISNIVESWGGKELAKDFNKLMKGEN